MGKTSFNNAMDRVVVVGVISGLKGGGQIKVGEALKQYFEGNAKSDQIVKVKSLTILKEKLAEKSNLHHEFLLIELHKFADHVMKMTIRADKNYNTWETLQAGESVGGVIGVQLVIPDPHSLEGATEKCKIKLKKCGGIAIKDLFNDLTAHVLRYSIGMNNCWKYAYDASCKVLKRCEELPDTSAETKEAIKQFRESELEKPDLLGESVTSSRVTGAVIAGAVGAIAVLCSGSNGAASVTSNPGGNAHVVDGLGIGALARTVRNSRFARRIGNETKRIILTAFGCGVAYCVGGSSLYAWRVGGLESLTLSAASPESTDIRTLQSERVGVLA